MYFLVKKKIILNLHRYWCKIMHYLWNRNSGCSNQTNG